MVFQHLPNQACKEDRKQSEDWDTCTAASTQQDNKRSVMKKGCGLVIIQRPPLHILTSSKLLVHSPLFRTTSLDFEILHTVCTFGWEYVGRDPTHELRWGEVIVIRLWIHEVVMVHGIRLHNKETMYLWKQDYGENRRRWMVRRYSSGCVADVTLCKTPSL